MVVFADDYDRRTAGSGEPDGAAIQLIFDASNPNDASSGAGYLRSVLLAEGTDYVLEPRNRDANEPALSLRLLRTGSQIQAWPALADAV